MCCEIHDTGVFKTQKHVLSRREVNCGSVQSRTWNIHGTTMLMGIMKIALKIETVTVLTNCGNSVGRRG